MSGRSGVIKEGELEFAKSTLGFTYWSTIYAQILRLDHSLFIFDNAESANRGEYRVQINIPKDDDKYRSTSVFSVEADQQSDSEGKRPFVFRVVSEDGVAQLFAVKSAHELAEWIDALANFHAHRRQEESAAALKDAKVRLADTLRANNQPPVLQLADESLFQMVPLAKFKHALRNCDARWTAPPAPLPRGRFTIASVPLLMCRSDLPPWASPAGAMSESSFIDRIALRAHSCAVAAVLGSTVHGVAGGNGIDGLDGERGLEGMHGSSAGADGGIGGRGGPGTNGHIGLGGTPGLAGASCNLVLADYLAATTSLLTSGSFAGEFVLGSCGVLLIDAKGGDGGNGGHGGRGGDGGRGGGGGSGARGMHGHSAHWEGGRGGNGGRGGRGGDGGAGGAGGTGARGGDGAAAGAGGHVLVSAYDPRLFMLVECDARPGLRGSGGRGGRRGAGGHGGSAGDGGPGGLGGSGGPPRRGSHVRGAHGFSGPSGDDGKEGRNGDDGGAGTDGFDGSEAPAGSFAFSLLRRNPHAFEVIECSGARYEASVVTARVTASTAEADMGGVFTPGSLLVVDQIVVLNDGGMALPSGADLRSVSTASLTWLSGQVREELPSVQVNEEFVLPTSHSARLFDIALPQLPERFVGRATFTVQTSLLGRPFRWSALSISVPVQWPVFIEDVSHPSVLSVGDTAIVAITMKNVSAIVMPGSRLQWELSFRGKVQIVSEGAPPEAVLHERDATVPITLGAGESTTSMLSFELTRDALLFEHYVARVSLVLDGRLIEFRDIEVRVAPRYNPNLARTPAADALIFTNSQLTRNEFVALNAFVSALGLSYDMWDCERENGVSVDANTGQRHALSWVGRYHGATLLFCAPETQLSLLQPIDFVDHFVGTDWRTWAATQLTSLSSEHAHRSHGSGCVLLGSQVGGPLSEFLSRVFHEASLRLEAFGDVFGGTHLFSWAEEPDAIKKANEIADRFNRCEPDKWFKVASVAFTRAQASATSFYYGAAVIHMLPLLRSTRLCVLETTISSLAAGMPDSLEGALRLPSEIPVASQLFEVLVAMVRSRPMAQRVALLGSESFASVTFRLPNDMALPWPQVIAMTIFNELELHYMPQHVQSLPLLEEFVRAVERFALLGVRAYSVVAPEPPQFQAAAQTRQFALLNAYEVLPLLSILYRFQRDVLGRFDGGAVRAEFFYLKERLKRVCLPPSSHGDLRVQLKDGAKRLSRSSLFSFHNACSSHLAIVPHLGLGNLATRVCDACFNRLTGVEWQPLESATECAACRGKFGLLRSRVHCHSCGGVHCKACTRNMCRVPQNPNEGHAPVCDRCYVALIEHDVMHPDVARAYFAAQRAAMAAMATIAPPKSPMPSAPPLDVAQYEKAIGQYNALASAKAEEHVAPPTQQVDWTKTDKHEQHQQSVSTTIASAPPADESDSE